MIEKMNLHYSFNNPASIHDEEALTALELAGRQGAKINEVITDQNTLRQETENHLEQQDTNIDKRMDAQDTAIEKVRTETVPADVTKEVQKQIKNGTFDKQIDESLGNLEERVNNLLENVPEGSTTMDAEVVDVRTRANGKVYDNAGNSVRAIDEDLQTEKTRTHGTTCLFDRLEQMYPNWGATSPSVGVFTAMGNKNSGLFTPKIKNPKTKFYIHVDITSDRTFSGLIALISLDSKVLKTSYLTAGANVYTFDTTDIADDFFYIMVGHNGTQDGELTWTYTLTKLVAELSIMRDHGNTNGNYAIDYILDHDQRLKSIDSGHTLFNDVAKMRGVWGTNVFHNDNTDAYFTAVGDKGIATTYLTVEAGNMLRVSFDLEKEDGYTVGVYVAETMWNFKHVKAIADSGHYDIVIDPAYYPVYTNLNSIHYVAILHHTGTLGTEVTTKVSNLAIWQNKLADAGLPSNVVDALVQLSTKSGGEGTEPTTNSTHLMSPDGFKYLPQVDANGTLQAVPVVPNKALYLGNSLLLGFGEFGMAASEVTKDYYYLMNQAIKEQRPTFTATRSQASAWEGLTTMSEKNAYLTNTLLPLLSEDLELVIVQLGDNVNTDEKLAVFPESAVDLLQFIRSHCPKARVAWMGAWYQSQTRMDAMVTACEQTGSIFINIWDLHKSSNVSAVGNTYTMADGTVKTITSEGVASHPGDAGFKAIANRALCTLGIVDTENYYE